MERVETCDQWLVVATLSIFYKDSVIKFWTKGLGRIRFRTSI